LWHYHPNNKKENRKLSGAVPLVYICNIIYLCDGTDYDFLKGIVHITS
jgi:hypothetical protein